MDTTIPALETAVTVVVGDLADDVTRFGGPDYVLFRFGGDRSHNRVDLNVPYHLLDRLAALIAKSQRIYAMDEPPGGDEVELV